MLLCWTGPINTAEVTASEIDTSLLSTTLQQFGGVSSLEFLNGISCDPIRRLWSSRFTRQLWRFRKSSPKRHSSFMSATHIGWVMAKVPTPSWTSPFPWMGTISPVTVRRQLLTGWMCCFSASVRTSTLTIECFSASVRMSASRWRYCCQCQLWCHSLCHSGNL